MVKIKRLKWRYGNATSATLHATLLHLQFPQFAQSFMRSSVQSSIAHVECFLMYSAARFINSGSSFSAPMAVLHAPHSNARTFPVLWS
jgi:hypothetical protein